MDTPLWSQALRRNQNDVMGLAREYLRMRLLGKKMRYKCPRAGMCLVFWHLEASVFPGSKVPRDELREVKESARASISVRALSLG